MTRTVNADIPCPRSPRATLTLLHRELRTRLDRLGAPPEARSSGTYENLADVAQVLAQREREIADRARLQRELQETAEAEARRQGRQGNGRPAWRFREEEEETDA